MATRVAIAGATGNLGRPILQELLDRDFDVTVLSRKGSNSTDSLLKKSNQKIVNVDFENVENLTSALHGIDVVVSTLAIQANGAQNPLIDASVAAGVKRFIPSEFGADMTNSLNRASPVFKGKADTQEYIESLVAKHPTFTYTYTYNHLFLDWGLKMGFFANLKEHSALLFDGGDVPFSATTLVTIGKAVVGIIKNLEATKNRAVYYHDCVLTLNKIIELVKGIDGKEWKTEVKQTKDVKQAAMNELQKPDGDVSKAMVDLILSAVFNSEHDPDLSGKLDNKLLGIPEKSDDEIKEILKSLL